MSSLKSLYMCAKPFHSCLTLCDPMDYGQPGSSVHGILQARILEWVVMLSSRGSSQHRVWTQVSQLQADSLLSEPSAYSGGGLFQVASCRLLIVSSGGREPKEEASSLNTVVTEALVPPMRILPSCLHLIKITFWRPHLLILSHCVEGFQLTNFQQIFSL